MGFFMASVAMILLLATATAAQNCYRDEDCSPNEYYCYLASNNCAKYTNCASFDRQEGEIRARDAKQCGPCLAGFSADINTDGQEATVCKKKEENGSPYKTNLIWLTIVIPVVLVIIILYCLCCGGKLNWFKKFSSCDIERAATDVKPTAPPAPSNNNDYSYRDEQRQPLQAKDSIPFDVFLMMEQNKKVQAQAFEPPEWVAQNPNYDPSESPAAPTNTLEIQDEETIQSTWTPGQSTSTTVNDRPFASISAEQADNTTNTALDRRCPVPSSSGQESTDNNGPSATPRPEHSNSNPNHSSATFIRASVNVNLITPGCCSTHHK